MRAVGAAMRKGANLSLGQIEGWLWLALGQALCWVLLIGVVGPATAQGQVSKIFQARGFKGPPAGGATTMNSKTLPPLLHNVGITQELNRQVPLDLQFRDETGKAVYLSDYFGEKPVILSLVYFECPQLCPMVEDGLLHSLKQIKFDLGKQYNVLTVSFDPRDTPGVAFAKRALYLNMYNRNGAAEGWHFLTGDESSIRALTEAVGFHYNFDPQTGQFAHATAIVVLTPQGRISRYFYGINYPPGQVRLALVEASHDKIGNPVDALLLFCCRYNVAQGKYSLIVSHVLFIAALVTLILLGGLLFVLIRGGRRAHA